MLGEADGRQLPREVIVAILGVVIGACSTALNRFIESEYQYQRNLTVLQYNDDCQSRSQEHTAYPYLVDCTLSLRASGPNAVNGVRLAVTAPGLVVTSDRLSQTPNFAPPNPPLQTETNSLDPGFAAVYAARIHDPQALTWNITAASKSPIDANLQIQRTVTTDNDSVQIEDGEAWRWKRWVPVGTVALILPAAVAILLLFAMWTFRLPSVRRRSYEALETD